VQQKTRHLRTANRCSSS